jgi:hypothetical protein
VSQQRNPLWIANQLRRDNDGLGTWTARVDFESAARAEVAMVALREHGASALAPTSAPAEATVDFRPVLVSTVARIIVVHGGQLLFAPPPAPPSSRD